METDGPTLGDVDGRGLDRPGHDDPPTEKAPAPTARALLDLALAAPPADQLALFERAHHADLNDPIAMSWYGMAVATHTRRYLQGIVLCEEAVRRQGPAPDLLVNLAKAYLVAKNKRAAVHALRRAMNRSRGVDSRAQAELAALGIRRTPVLPFLPRSFFLNAWLGRLRSRILTRVGRDADGSLPVPAELGTVSGDVEQARRALAQGTPGEGA